jgi:hypothetical protein
VADATPAMKASQLPGRSPGAANAGLGTNVTLVDLPERSTRMTSIDEVVVIPV